MKCGDLFSGVGGFALAAHSLGWSTSFFSEYEPYAAGVLADRFPDIPNLGDITRIDWSTVDRPDLLCGGFPCQPTSSAGKRLGDADVRWLWPEYARAIRHLRPDFVVVENPTGLLTSGRGRFMGLVLGELASLGYDAEWLVLSAADVGAPHLRRRVWIVAAPAPFPDALSLSLRELREWIERQAEHAQPWAPELGDGGEAWDPTDLDFFGGGEGIAEFEGLGGPEEPDGSGGARYPEGEAAAHDADGLGCDRDDGRDHGERRGPHPAERCAPAAHPDGLENGGLDPGREDGEGAGLAAGAGEEAGADRERERLEGLEPAGAEAAAAHRSGQWDYPGWWHVEPGLVRVVYGVPDRVDRIRCLGNSLVPACARLIFLAIEASRR